MNRSAMKFHPHINLFTTYFLQASYICGLIEKNFPLSRRLYWWESSPMSGLIGRANVFLSRKSLFKCA